MSDSAAKIYADAEIARMQLQMKVWELARQQTGHYEIQQAIVRNMNQVLAGWAASNVCILLNSNIK